VTDDPYGTDALGRALAAAAEQVRTAFSDAGTRAVAGLALGQVFAGEPDIAAGMLRALSPHQLGETAAAAGDLARLALSLTPSPAEPPEALAALRAACDGRLRQVRQLVALLDAEQVARLRTAVETLYVALHDRTGDTVPDDEPVYCGDCPDRAPALVWRAWAGQGGGWAHPGAVPDDGHFPRPLVGVAEGGTGD
jgi:hypothetical protein